MIIDKPKEPYTTLLIGPNGTGKSNLLRILILFFQELNEFKVTGKRAGKVTGKFSFQYSYNGNHYSYFNYLFEEIETSIHPIKREVRPIVLKNGKAVLNNAIELPISIIAHSIILTDKFPTEIKGFENYVYLGVRNTASSARTTTYVRKTVDLLFDTLDNDFLLNNIGKGLAFLEYEKYLFISYKPRYKNTIFREDLTEEKFTDFFLKFWQYMDRDKDSPPWSLPYFKKTKKEQPDKIKRLVLLCKKISSRLQHFYEGGRSQYFGFDIFKGIYTVEEIKLIKDLYALDLLSYPTLTFKKMGREFNLEQSSSGEYHFISGFIGLLSKLEENSLVLIDEPENSLHPNWQMKYISFFKMVFKEFTSCHFIITTHSHFLVSDLKGNSSALRVLRKHQNHIVSESIPGNTYGWAAEEILLTIFKTPTSRNYYLSEQLNKIFDLISDEPDKRNADLLKSEINKLKSLDLSGLSSADPLKDVIYKLTTSF